MRTGVAIALYNGRKFLKEQIDSLLLQTQAPDVIVCCDDGSTDGTLEWLESYICEKQVSERFILVRNESNLGYAQNFYKALDLCDADILFLCDQDDIWGLRKIELMCAAFDKYPQYDLISCAHDLIGAQSEQLSSLRYSQRTGTGELRAVTENEIVTFFQWPGMTMALRKEFWVAVRNDCRSIPAPHDRVLALLAASRSAMAYLDRVLCSHRLHTANNGGEEDSLRTILNRAFKIKELSTSLKWLDAQIASGAPFSPAVVSCLKGYRDYVSLRLQAIEQRSPILLGKTLRYRKYVHWKGLAADLAVIILNR